MFKIEDVEETDIVLLRDGRIGTIMGIYPGTTGLEIETDNSDPDTETHDIDDIVLIQKDSWSMAEFNLKVNMYRKTINNKSK